MAAEPALAPKAEKPAPGDGGAGRLARWLRNYKPLPGVPDELFDDKGQPRDNWLSLLGAVAEFPEEEFSNRFAMATRHIRDTGVSYRVYGEEHERTWPLNPLPLVLSDSEWSQIAEGVEQRARLMEGLLQDIYGEAQLLADGALPAAAITGSSDFLRPMRGVTPPGGRYLQLYAADIGRGPDGRWWVLDDRAQGPSGAGYALENRLVLSRAYPTLYNSMNVQRLAPFFDQMRKGLATASQRSDPRICLLSPGPFSETYFEQAHLARYLGFLLVEGADLVVSEGKAYVRTIAGLKRADVIVRRVDADYIDPLELNSRSHLGTPGLVEAIRSGGVSVLNMPGSGVLESKALLGFLPKLARTLLGEELKMPNIATWWCGQPGERKLVEENLETVAIGPAFQGAGPDGVSTRSRLMGDLTDEQRSALMRHWEARPGDYVGQEVVRLSTMPTLRDGELAPAPFVLRVYAAMTEDGMKIMPGGFCRTSERQDARAVSMGADVRTADVWVIGERPVERITLMSRADQVKVRRIMGHLPSRAADNLYWLGRYLERAEATLRLVRSLCTSLMDSEAALHASGETLSKLEGLLVGRGALDEDDVGCTALAATRSALLDAETPGSVIGLVRSARRTASSLRERLSADFWALLLNLESRLERASGEVQSEGQALQTVEAALQTLAALEGLSHENMNRGAGWRFLDMGRRIERAQNTCSFTRVLACGEATPDDLDLLLDLVDTQITYRSRYLEGLALIPVLDIVMLDPLNPRAAAFQIHTLREHLEKLPVLLEDGIPEKPLRLLAPLSALAASEDAASLDGTEIMALENALMRVSNAIEDRYFLQGANAVPTAKLAGLA